MKLKLVALALLSTTSIAFAADPAARTYTKAPVVAAPIWSGFYIGCHGRLQLVRSDEHLGFHRVER